MNAFRTALCLVGIACTAASWAHTRSESYSQWHIDESSVTGIVTIPLREVMLLYQSGGADVPPRDLFRRQIEDRTSIRSAGGECPRTTTTVLQAASGFVRVETNFDCGSEAPATLTYRAMFEVAPAHVHYARAYHNGVETGESLLTDTADQWSFADLQTPSSYSFRAFLVIGIEHITGGIDHIAFLLGLLLIAGSISRSVIAVTGFTLGHSASLAAAVLGYLSAESQLVEAFIGFTVALVAVEYFLLRRNRVMPYAVICLLLALTTGVLAVAAGFLESRALFAYAGFGLFATCYLLAASGEEQRSHKRATALMFVATACFGLVHGFGFAGFLMETGLLGADLFIPLLGFNLGVEAGQLMLVAAAVTAGAMLRRRIPPLFPQAIAAGLCGLGLYWFVERSLA